MGGPGRERGRRVHATGRPGVQRVDFGDSDSSPVADEPSEMSLEQTLSGWTGPSSDTEQEKQQRTVRMVRDAVDNHAAFRGCSLNVYAKGSYSNNTNVRTDSDVDVGVQCQDVEYWEEQSAGAHKPGSGYTGIWTPARLRDELRQALRAKFPGQVDDSGSTAFIVHSGSARVDADVVPCFDYKYYFTSGSSRTGSKLFRTEGSSFVNYPEQQLVNGSRKNTDTGSLYKKAVRVMKRVENAMVTAKTHREVPSFFIECLVFNCPNSIITRTNWTDRVEGIIVHIWQKLQGDEPSDSSQRWVEANECKWLFTSAQDWTRADGRDFVKAAWNYLGYKS